MDLNEYITESEEVKFRWVGGLEEGADQTQFAATEQRLLYVTESGFKDIECAHISSVEVNESTQQDYDSVDFPPGSFSIILGGFGGLFGTLALFGNSPLLGIILLPTSIVLFIYGWIKIDNLSDLLVDPDEKTIYEIQIITGDEIPQQIALETEADVGSQISRVVRNSNSRN